MEKRKKLALSTQIFIALVLAIGAGIALTGNPDFAKSYIKPFGTIFLNLIKWIVCPLVFFSIMAGVVSMRDIKKVGVIGGRTILYYMCTTAFAVAIGLLFANLLKGIFPVLSTAELSYEPAATSVNFMDTLVGIFPSNFLKPFVDANMLQIIVSSLFIGLALILIGHRFDMEFGDVYERIYRIGIMEVEISARVIEVAVCHQRISVSHLLIRLPYLVHILPGVNTAYAHACCLVQDLLDIAFLRLNDGHAVALEVSEADAVLHLRPLLYLLNRGFWFCSMIPTMVFGGMGLKSTPVYW